MAKKEYYEASPHSIEKIRRMTEIIREIFGYEVNENIDVRLFMDDMSVKLGDRFNFVILEDEHKRFMKNEEAHTDITNGTIYIKESVFADLENWSSRGHFTIAHEIGHYFLHHLLGSVLSRKSSPDKAYIDPEWQADQFAAEFLMPYEAVKDLNPQEIQRKYNVSLKAANVRYNKINKKGL